MTIRAALDELLLAPSRPRSGLDLVTTAAQSADMFHIATRPGESHAEGTAPMK